MTTTITITTTLRIPATTPMVVGRDITMGTAAITTRAGESTDLTGVRDTPPATTRPRGPIGGRVMLTVPMEAPAVQRLTTPIRETSQGAGLQPVGLNS